MRFEGERAVAEAARFLWEGARRFVELKIGAQARGTRILALNNATKYRSVCDALVRMAIATGAEELVLPNVEPASLHRGIANQVLTFPDGTDKEKPLCLRPDGAPMCISIAETLWKSRHDVKLFYVTRCWRMQRPQLGHHREFTQFGFHVMNPRSDYSTWMLELARRMIGNFTNEFTVHPTLTTYPYDGPGFDICCDYLGAEKQGSRGRISAGGPHRRGFGISVEVDRVMLL